ncbi:MAG: hypothetical protein J5802_02815 [Butyrivibrio sp.]|nr:hypothetical protein [Butyrivibrio sp.]
MNNHILLVGALIIATISFLTLMVGNAVKSTKYKNNEEWKTVKTKALSVSAFVLGAVFLCWEVLTFFIDPSTTYTLDNMHSFVMILIGVQCIVAIVSAMYYEKKM